MALGSAGKGDYLEAKEDMPAEEYFRWRAKEIVKDAKDADPVNHPSHYKQGGLETIDAIEAWGLDFLLGNCVKYISRAGKKDAAKMLEDLRKAQWYLNRKVAKLEKP